MSVEMQVEHRAGYSVARVGGEPTLGEIIGLIQQLGAASRTWPHRRVLVDMRAVRSLRSFTEHYAIGEEAGRQFSHMARVASVVPADRITRASEKTARQAGVNLSVFTDEGAAIQWLEATPGGASA